MITFIRYVFLVLIGKFLSYNLNNISLKISNWSWMLRTSRLWKLLSLFIMSSLNLNMFLSEWSMNFIAFKLVLLLRDEYGMLQNTVLWSDNASSITPEGHVFTVFTYVWSRQASEWCVLRVGKVIRLWRCSHLKLSIKVRTSKLLFTFNVSALKSPNIIKLRLELAHGEVFKVFSVKSI